jgi:hypothetical protein
MKLSLATRHIALFVTIRMAQRRRSSLSVSGLFSPLMQITILGLRSRRPFPRDFGKCTWPLAWLCKGRSSNRPRLSAQTFTSQDCVIPSGSRLPYRGHADRYLQPKPLAKTYGIKPPSTLIAWPVTLADSSDARNTAIMAISSAVLLRRMGIVSSLALISSSMGTPRCSARSLLRR